MNRNRWAIALVVALFLGCAGNRQAVSPDRQADKIDRRMAEVKAQLARKGPDAEAYFQLAKLALAKSDTLQAFVYLDSSLSVKPEYAEARLLKGNLLYRRNQLRSAFEEFLVLLESDTLDKWTPQIGQTIGLLYPIRRLREEAADEANPSYSPNGKWLVFQSNLNKNWDIFLLDRESGEVKQLTSSPLHEENPVFLGNSRILFTRQQSPDSRSRDIVLLEWQTGQERAMVTDTSDDWFPVASSDSSRIYFVSDRTVQGQPGTRIFSVDVASGKVEPVFPDITGASLPFPLPDAGHLGFVRLMNGFYRPYSGDLGSGKIRLLSQIDMHFGAPHVSPDGKKLVFFSRMGENFDIFELELGTDHLDRLTGHPGRDLAPCYSPDGNEIAFYSDRSGRYQLYAMDVTRPYTHRELIERLRAALSGDGEDLRNISGLVPDGE